MPGPESFLIIVFLLFPVGLIVLIVALVRYTVGRSGTTAPPPPPRPSALDVLEERYARGEITREEFAERRSVLLGAGPSPQAQPAQQVPPPPPAP